MYVAEHPNHARTSEPNRTGTPGRIETDVEHLAAIAGKRVVENRVGVRELHRRSGYDRENMRRKHLVLLKHSNMTGVFERNLGLSIQPDHNSRIVLPLVNGGDLRVSKDNCP
jgi:hypothetical protein